MNSHALNVIEFPRTLALIAERATSPLGAERVRELEPVTDRDAIGCRPVVDHFHEIAWLPVAGNLHRRIADGAGAV